MKEGLERIDSSAMFFIALHKAEARKQFDDNARFFSEEFRAAAGNITEPGELDIINAIDSQYSNYKRHVEQFLNTGASTSPAVESEIYFSQLQPEFVALKDKLDELLHLNQEAMVAASERARRESMRAQISTAIVAALALLLAGVFAWRFTAYVVEPVRTLTGKARKIAEGDLDQHLDVHTHDETGLLAAEFNRMASRLRDVRQSDYWRLLLEQKKSDAVINSIYEPVIVTDANGRVLKINGAAEQLLSANRQGPKDDGDVSLSRFSAGEIIMRAVQDAVRMQRPVAAEGEAALVPVRVGGAERSYRMRTTPMRDEDGRMLGAVTVLEDITALREVDLVKTEFISVASEKLREPLRSLQLALHAVLTGVTGDLNDKQIEMLSDARQAAEQLDEMMSDLMQLAEIESGARPMAIERLRPIDLARAAIERFQSAADSKHLKLENCIWPDVSWVMGDRRAMKS